MLVCSFFLFTAIAARPSLTCFAEAFKVFCCSFTCAVCSSIVRRPSRIFWEAPFSFVSPFAISDAAFFFCESRVFLPSSIFFLLLSSFSSASSSLPSMASFTFLLTLSILSCWIITSIWFFTAPDSLTDATPFTLSSSGMIFCSTSLVTSAGSLSL